MANVTITHTGDPKPFVADAIIANKLSFPHIHCAEKFRYPSRVAVWQVRNTDVKFSASVATVLRKAGLVNLNEFDFFVTRCEQKVS